MVLPVRRGPAVLGVVLPLTIAVATAMWLRGPEDETVGGAG
ncbi:hypothetical protein [Gaopeijia maritima]